MVLYSIGIIYDLFFNKVWHRTIYNVRGNRLHGGQYDTSSEATSGDEVMHQLSYKRLFRDYEAEDLL